MLVAAYRQPNLVYERLVPQIRTLARTRPPAIAGRATAQYWFRRYPNVGDQLSPIITRRLLGIRPVWVRPQFEGKLIGLGSIADHVAPGDVVLGAGFLRPGPPINVPIGARIVSLRGPLSRERLISHEEIPEIYGDAGLLAPLLVAQQPRVDQEPGRVGVVPHYYDDEAAVAARSHGLTVIDVRSDPMTVFDQIRRCEQIVSSSLHGIIFAEAFGIPAVWLRPHEKMIGGRFKFRDYYLGTGRPAPEPMSLLDALDHLRGDHPSPWSPDVEQLERAHRHAASMLSGGRRAP